MRRLIVAAAAGVTLIAASSLLSGRAEALPLPGASGLGAAGQNELVHDVRYVCQPVWNGWRWAQSCFWTRPRYFAPRPYYYRGPYRRGPYRYY